MSDTTELLERIIFMEIKLKEELEGTSYARISDRPHLVSLPVEWRHIDNSTKILAPNRSFS